MYMHGITPGLPKQTLVKFKLNLIAHTSDIVVIPSCSWRSWNKRTKARNNPSETGTHGDFRRNRRTPGCCPPLWGDGYHPVGVFAALPGSTPLRKKVCTPAAQINFELRSTHSQPKVRTEATGDLGGVAAVSASRLPQQVSKKIVSFFFNKLMSPWKKKKTCTVCLY